jgi:hypothetical protein
MTGAPSMAILFFIQYLIPIFALLSLFLQSIAARRSRNFTGTEDQRHERENEQTGCQRWPQHPQMLMAATDQNLSGRSVHRSLIGTGGSSVFWIEHKTTPFDNLYQRKSFFGTKITVIQETE